MSLAMLAERYPHSNINVQEPASSGGLSEDTAAKLLLANGPNALTPPPRPPWLWITFCEFMNPLRLLLLVAGGLGILGWYMDQITGNAIVFAALFSVVVFDVSISLYQRWLGFRIQNAFGSLLPSKCNVIRNGVEVQVSVRSLVVGDILKVAEGGRMPADCRVLYSQALHVDNSSINGESTPFHVVATPSPMGTEPFDSNCLAFNGSPVCQGHAVRRVGVGSWGSAHRRNV
jgi:magnesium-transporting ATPase (P-type)